MKTPTRPTLAVLVLLGACAGSKDHFYALNALPASGRPSPTLSTHVRLDVTVPSLVDRSEMVLSGPGNSVQILEHERWASPLADVVAATLGRDLERQRDGVIVADRRFDQSSSPAVAIKVDIVRMTARRGGQASLEAHWRIVDSAAHIDRLGGGSFDASAGNDYAGIAAAYSELLGQLAKELAAGMRPP